MSTKVTFFTLAKVGIFPEMGFTFAEFREIPQNSEGSNFRESSKFRHNSKSKVQTFEEFRFNSTSEFRVFTELNRNSAKARTFAVVQIQIPRKHKLSLSTKLRESSKFNHNTCRKCFFAPTSAFH